jgi:hypothetical protein
MFLPESIGQFLSRFADDLNTPNKRSLERLVPLKAILVGLGFH